MNNEDDDEEEQQEEEQDKKQAAVASPRRPPVRPPHHLPPPARPPPVPAAKSSLTTSPNNNNNASPTSFLRSESQHNSRGTEPSRRGNQFRTRSPCAAANQFGTAANNNNNNNGEQDEEQVVTFADSPATPAELNERRLVRYQHNKSFPVLQNVLDYINGRKGGDDDDDDDTKRSEDDGDTKKRSDRDVALEVATTLEQAVRCIHDDWGNDPNVTMKGRIERLVPLGIYNQIKDQLLWLTNRSNDLAHHYGLRTFRTVRADREKYVKVVVGVFQSLELLFKFLCCQDELRGANWKSENRDQPS